MKIDNRPNSDLVPGQFIFITEWVGELEYIEHKSVGGMMVQRPVSGADGDENALGCDSPATRLKNKSLFGDVVRILAIDWPHILADVYSCKGPRDLSRSRVNLDARTFEWRPPSEEYIVAMIGIDNAKSMKAVPEGYTASDALRTPVPSA